MVEHRVELIVQKLSVYEEVAKTTSYVGGKSTDETLYDRVFTTDEDRQMLERFWRESATAATSLFRPYLIDAQGEEERREEDIYRDYRVSLVLPSTFDIALKESMEEALRSYFVSRIISSWLRLSLMEDGSKYAVDAVDYLNEVTRLLYHRKRPQRNIPNI